MFNKRFMIVLGLIGALTLGFATVAAIGRPSSSAQVQATTTVKPVKLVNSTINVTAGIPSELGFKLSKTSVPVGTVTFKVKNGGTVAHDFKICNLAAKTSKLNACLGKTTKLIQPGATATLIVKFTKAGSFEYLCTVAGHAAGGMKGLVGIGVKVAVQPTTTTGSTTTGSTTPTTTTQTTTATAPKETLGGDPVNGAAVFKSAGCASCHTLKAAGASGTVGPNLDDSKPGQDLVVQRVTNGLNVMPSFSGSLSAQQIKDVAAYVYQSTH